MKTVKLLLILLALLLVMPLAVSAERALPLVVDEAGLLSAEEESKLLVRLEAVSAELQCEIAVVTVRSLGGKTAQEFADDYYDENGYGYGENDDGVLLLVSMEYRDWAITTHGKARRALNEEALDGLEDRVIPLMSEGDYYRAFSNYSYGCQTYIRYYESPSSVEENDVWLSYLDQSFDEEFHAAGKLLAAAAVGIVLAFITVSVMKSKLISVRSRDEAGDYVRKDSFHLTKSHDIFLYHTVTKVRRDTDSGSGRSGGGSHRSSSGRSHGGRSGKF